MAIGKFERVLTVIKLSFNTIGQLTFILIHHVSLRAEKKHVSRHN